MAKRRRNKRKNIWIVVSVLLITAAVVAFVVARNHQDNGNEEGETNESISEEEKDEIEERNENQTINQPEETIEKKKVEQYEGEDPNIRNDLSGVVTYANLNGDNLAIRVNIDQYLESGKCELILERNGATIYNSIAEIIDNASTATCEGFDVPVKGLGGGMVDIIINLSAGDRFGQIRGEANI